MANITTLTDGTHLFLDEVKDLYIPGSISEPKHIEVVDWRFPILRPGGSIDTSTTLVDGYFYSDFTGNISLDFSDAIKRQSNFTPYDQQGTYGGTNAPKTIRWLSDEEMIVETEVSLCSSLVKEKITDIDYLAVPKEAWLGLTYFCPKNYSYSGKVIQGCRSEEVFSYQTAASESRLNSVALMLSDLPLRAGVPFQFIIRLTSTVDDEPDLIYRSAIYEIMEGDFQEFAFADRFGGYTFIPLSGALELSSEYTFENASYHGGARAKVSGSGIPAFTQYTGGLTRKAAAALSALLLSDRIYHRIGNTWHQIIVDDADIVFHSVDSLHYGSFSFRYMEKLELTDVI